MAQTASPPIRGITVSVGYADMLGITLPRALQHVEECLVVTTPGDPSIDVARSVPGVRIYETTSFYSFGAAFNKGLALEEGFDALGRDGWILIFDADIVLPQQLPLDQLDPRLIYSCPRRILTDPTRFSNDLDWAQCLRFPEGSHLGFFQLFHADAVKDIRPWYEVTLAQAGGADHYFAKHWPRHHRKQLKSEVLHLGPKERNWFGRSTPRIDGSLPPNAERNRDMMDAFIVRNGWQATHPEADPSATLRVGNIVDRVAVPGYERSEYELSFVRAAKRKEAAQDQS